MKIEGFNTVTADPFRIGRIGAGSEAIAQASNNRDKEVTQPRNAVQKEKPTAEETVKVVEEINSRLSMQNRSIRFSVDDGTHDIVVRVVDKKSGEVIKELPPESELKLRERMAELSGLMVEEEV